MLKDGDNTCWLIIMPLSLLKDDQKIKLDHIAGAKPFVLNSSVEESAVFEADTEDSITWFSYAQLQDGSMSCVPPGSSQVFVNVSPEGVPEFEARLSRIENAVPWRLEANAFRHSHAKVAAIYFGLPPLLITINRSDQSTVARTEREESFMTKTTRLLYVGHFINEQGHLGMRRDLHVYMEYYSIEPHVGHRVGALVSDLPFEHYKVDGALTIR